MPGMDPLAQAKYSARFAEVYESKLRFRALCNDYWEGDVTEGGSVKIFTPGDVDISAYTRDSTTIAYQRVRVGEQVMNITKREYFALKADDYEKAIAFAGGKMWQRTIDRGTFKMAKSVDTYISGTVLANAVPTANVLSPRTVGQGLNANFYETLIDLLTVLDDNDVPLDDVGIVIPPAGEGLLRKDERFVSFGTADSRRTLAGAPIGEIDGATILKSTSTPVSGTTYSIYAVAKDAVTYAEALSDMENVPRDKDDFENRVRNQLIYDAYAVLPMGIAKVNVQFAA